MLSGWQTIYLKEVFILSSAITHTIAQRVSCYLEKAGYLERDVESAYVNLQTDDEDAMAANVCAPISYRLAFGRNAGLGAPDEKY